MTEKKTLSQSEFWNVFCQQFFEADGNVPQTLLDTQGVANLSMLTSQAPHAVLEHVKRRVADAENVEYRSSYQDFLFLPDADEPLLLMALAMMCDGDLGALIRQHFQSEFTVMWAKFLVTLSGPRADATELEPDNPTDRLLSAMWHRDGGLSPFVHVIVYLNDFAKHRGSTEFLDLDTSRRIIDAGHTHLDAEGDVFLRGARFEETIKAKGISTRPISFEPTASEGVDFNAPNCFHREVLPTTATRYVMLLAMAPSPLPWRQSYEVRPAVQARQGTVVWSEDFMRDLFGETKRLNLTPKNDRWRDLIESQPKPAAE